MSNMASLSRDGRDGGRSSSFQFRQRFPNNEPSMASLSLDSRDGGIPGSFELQRRFPKNEPKYGQQDKYERKQSNVGTYKELASGGYPRMQSRYAQQDKYERKQISSLHSPQAQDMGMEQ